MLIDHIGYVLFPEIEVLRLIGRIAMPIFAFFIGEGCLYTKNRRKYFLRVFLLGLICQAVYVAESLISGSGNGAYLNILLTFSFSILLCSAFLGAKQTFNEGSKKEILSKSAIFTLTVIFFGGAMLFCQSSTEAIGINVYFDYGACGILLPLFAAVSRNKTKRLLIFSAALTAFVFILYDSADYRLCALIPLGLLMFYNGEGGKANLKYFFYAFYPCHLAAIYLLDYII